MVVPTPDPVFGAGGPTAWKVFVVGFFLGVIVMHVLQPDVRVVRLKVIDGGRAEAGTP